MACLETEDTRERGTQNCSFIAVPLPLTKLDLHQGVRHTNRISLALNSNASSQGKQRSQASCLSVQRPRASR